MSCPAAADLAEHIFSDPRSRSSRSTARHLDGCAACRGKLDALRETAAALRENGRTDRTTSTACLGETELAAAADGLCEEEHSGGRWLEHLAECGACRIRFAELKRFLADAAIGAEVHRLEGAHLQTSRRPRVPPFVAAATGLAVAVLGGVMLLPEPPSGPDALQEGVNAPHRESAITTTVAPRILAPEGPTAAGHSLVWSSVPHADRYRVRVFERDGTLAWDEHTRDTTLAIPARLSSAPVKAYLWKVEARTGWDRWVASDWRDLVIEPETASR